MTQPIRRTLPRGLGSMWRNLFKERLDKVYRYTCSFCGKMYQGSSRLYIQAMVTKWRGTYPDDYDYQDWEDKLACKDCYENK